MCRTLLTPACTNFSTRSKPSSTRLVRVSLPPFLPCGRSAKPLPLRPAASRRRSAVSTAGKGREPFCRASYQTARELRAASKGERAVTFCVGINVHEGLVGIADTRVLSGSECITARKVTVYQQNGQAMFLMTSGLRSLRDKALTYFAEVV